MKFSAQEEYGLRCLIAIARKGEGGAMTIPDLAISEGLSQPHIGKLMSILRRSGHVKSTRGQIGGYLLAKRPDQILLGEVLADLGGRLYYDGFCDRHSGVKNVCVHDQQCNLRGLWGRIQAAVDSVVMNLTLQDLLDDKLDQLIPLQSLTGRRNVQASLKS